ncbi:hypothetical protein ACFOLG_12875 [Vogesella facilis]|uniref:Nucleoside 2-deoxyribosyltransferase n=1 Tax=Vogesella facilis TaxID=1655232 RepID=A0ABV7RG81_9NEIS
MKTCFVISPIGDDGSEVRQRADKVLLHIIKPALQPLGYEIIRADSMPKTGMITSQIVNAIVDSDLVIADLTGHNPNVFYELAIRHCSNKPYIHLIEKGDKLPFDIHGVRAIPISVSDIAVASAAINGIKENVRSYEDGHVADSPVSIARKVGELLGDNSLIEELLGRLEELESAVSNVPDEVEWNLDTTIEAAADEVKTHIDEQIEGLKEFLLQKED